MKVWEIDEAALERAAMYHGGVTVERQVDELGHVVGWWLTSSEYSTPALTITVDELALANIDMLVSKSRDLFREASRIFGGSVERV